MSVLLNAAADTSSLDDKPLALEITALIFEGKNMRKRRLAVHDTYPSTGVWHVKQKIQEQLDSPPEEVELLVCANQATDIALDSAKLADYGVRAAAHLKALVYYDIPCAWTSERDHDNTDLPSTPSARSDDLSEPGDLGDICVQPLDLFPEEGPATAPPRGDRTPPPPLLLQCGGDPELMSTCLWSESESLDVQEGRLFELQVNGMIFLGQYSHRRSCSLPVSMGTKVSDVKARLEMWLGARPDELILLTTGAVPVEGDGTLGDYQIVPGAQISALAWYENASRMDLPPRKSRNLVLR